MTPDQLIERVRTYIALVEARAPTDEIMAFYAPTIVQEEFPNQLLPNGAVRDAEALRAADASGRNVLSSQTYEITNIMASGNTVLVEALWNGVLAIGFGTLKIGDTMSARFAQVYEFDGDKIVRQRNYDCFNPW